MPLTIGIDGSRLAVSEPTGTETYTARIIRAIAELGAPDLLRVYLTGDSPPRAIDSSIDLRHIPFPRFWTHGRLSWEMLRRRPDVLFVPAHVIPLIHPRSVVTIHDLGFLHEPDSHPAHSQLALDWSTRWSVRVARRIIAVSAATAQDLHRSYGVDPHKIRIVHHGVDPVIRTPPENAVNAVRTRLGLPDPFILSVGTVQPRKNYGRLAEAMGRVAAAGLPHRLVIAGKRGWLADRVESEIAASGSSGRVIQLGYVAAADLAVLYAAADLVCLPSLFEGFGLPLLEAMAHGVPTAASDRAALPEVGGDATLRFDPLDIRQIGEALVRGLTDDDTRRRLSVAGPRRAAQFTWERAARETLAVLHDVGSE